MAGTIGRNDLYGGSTVAALSDAASAGQAAPAAPGNTAAAVANNAPGGASMGSLSAISWAWVALVAIGVLPRVIYDLAS